MISNLAYTTLNLKPNPNILILNHKLKLIPTLHPKVQVFVSILLITLQGLNIDFFHDDITALVII